MELRPEEIRVLAALVEKEGTTPDVYPLSTNAALLACNQRTSREPVVEYDEDTVTAALVSLRERGLARTMRGEGSRVYKHAHTLGQALSLDRAALAVLSVLMLRGPQTAGELRGRCERQHVFGSTVEVEAVLERLAAREEPLAELLPRAPGQKEARWRHLLGGEQPVPVAPPAAPAEADGLEELRAGLADLRARVERLEALF